MKRFFNFTATQLGLVIFLSIVFLILSVYNIIHSMTTADEESVVFKVQVDDTDRQYHPLFKVDLNHSPVDSLELLPGIGPTLAARIASYRDSVRFKEPGDIVRVKGVGEKLYEAIKIYLEVNEW